VERSAIKPADVRAAREFLRKRGVRGVSPRAFARSAMESGMTYQTLLESLAGVAKRKLKND
jgi:hypothetical protein